MCKCFILVVNKPKEQDGHSCKALYLSVRTVQTADILTQTAGGCPQFLQTNAGHGHLLPNHCLLTMHICLSISYNNLLHNS